MKDYVHFLKFLQVLTCNWEENATLWFIARKITRSIENLLQARFLQHCAQFHSVPKNIYSHWNGDNVDYKLNFLQERIVLDQSFNKFNAKIHFGCSDVERCENWMLMRYDGRAVSTGLVGLQRYNCLFQCHCNVLNCLGKS